MEHTDRFLSPGFTEQAQAEADEAAARRAELDERNRRERERMDRFEAVQPALEAREVSADLDARRGTVTLSLEDLERLLGRPAPAADEEGESDAVEESMGLR